MELGWESEKKKKMTRKRRDESWARLYKRIERTEQDMSSLALEWEPFF